MSDLSKFINYTHSHKSKRIQHNEIIHRKILETELKYMTKLNGLIVETLSLPEIHNRTKMYVGIFLGTLYQYMETIHPEIYHDREDRYNRKKRLIIYECCIDNEPIWKHISETYYEGNKVLFKMGSKLKMVEGEENPYLAYY